MEHNEENTQEEKMLTPEECVELAHDVAERTEQMLAELGIDTEQLIKRTMIDGDGRDVVHGIYIAEGVKHPVVKSGMLLGTEYLGWMQHVMEVVYSVGHQRGVLHGYERKQFAELDLPEIDL